MKKIRGYYETQKVMDILGLPVTVTAMNVMENGLHWHDHMEILYCKKGQLKVRVNELAYQLNPGDFLVINSGESHEIYDGKKGDLQVICSIDLGILGNMEHKSIRCATTMGDIPEEEDAELVRMSLSEMAYLCLLDPYNPEHLPLSREEDWNRYHMYMYQLLMVLVKYKKEETSEQQQHHDLLHQCVSYINEHVGTELNARILAERFHVSESTIYRLFAQEIGIPLNQYITTVRIHAVCRSLEDSTEKITNIAFDSGFTGLSNFYRVFQEYMGMTPKEYRKSHGNGVGSPLLQQLDVMKLNKYQTFYELGLEKNCLSYKYNR